MIKADNWPDFLHRLKALKHQVRSFEARQPYEYELFKIDLAEWKLRLSTHTPFIWVKSEMARRLPAAELAASLRDIANEHGWRHQANIVLLEGDGTEVQAEVHDWYSPSFVIIGQAEQQKILSAASFTYATLDVICAQLPLANLAPYEVGAPVEDSRFFGRETEIRRILEHPGTSFAITGVRRIGKTSLLKEIRRRMIDQGEAEQRLVWLDCSTLYSLDQFVQELVRRLHDRELRRLDKQTGQVHFYLVNFLERMRKMHKGPITIFLDEADQFLVWARNVWATTLRASVNTGDCRYIMAGFQDLMNESYNAQSPFYQALEMIRLKPFERRDTEALVLGPLRSLRVRFTNEQELVNRIHAATRGHPRLVQHYCQELIERLERRRARTLTPDDLEGIYNSTEFRALVVNSFRDNVSKEDQLLVYALLAGFPEGKESFTQEEMYGALRRRSITLAQDRIDRSCEQLVLAGVLAREGLKYEFVIPVFPQVMRANYDVKFQLSALKREMNL